MSLSRRCTQQAVKAASMPHAAQIAVLGTRPAARHLPSRRIQTNSDLPMHCVPATPGAMALSTCTLTPKWRDAAARNVGQEAISSAEVQLMLPNQSRNDNVLINMLKGCSSRCKFKACIAWDHSHLTVHEAL
jgi:hypothetical protein